MESGQIAAMVMIGILVIATIIVIHRQDKEIKRLKKESEKWFLMHGDEFMLRKQLEVRLKEIGKEKEPIKFFPVYSTKA